jgi:hypothetical protein
MYADFGGAAVAPQVDVGDAGASFEEQLKFLESAEFIGLARDDDSQLELASLPASLRPFRPDRAFAMFMMMMVVAVITFFAMRVMMAVIAFFAMRMAFVAMPFAMRMVVIVTAFRAALMPSLVIVIARGPVNALFFVR